MSKEDTTVACIGLGRMGAGIARNIQRAGFTLRVYNRTAAKMTKFFIINKIIKVKIWLSLIIKIGSSQLREIYLFFMVLLIP